MPSKYTSAEEEEAWRLREEAHTADVEARAAAARVVVDRANAAEEEKVRAHEEEAKARAEGGQSGTEAGDTLEEGALPSSSGGAVRDVDVDEGELPRAGKVADKARAQRESTGAEAKAKVALKSPHWKKAMAKAKAARATADKVDHLQGGKLGPENDSANVAIAEAMGQQQKAPHWKKSAAKNKAAAERDHAARVQRKMGKGTDHSDSAVYSTWLARHAPDSLGWGGAGKPQRAK